MQNLAIIFFIYSKEIIIGSKPKAWF